ncbi:MAG: SDR family oxidoreductase [Epsilonproteobacteria bacterium]|nr:SDR family oxidoreductase [Campylobacterota bacterium]
MKKALITGGNKGIGLELTKMFLALNYEVIVIARDFSNFELKEQVECIAFDLVEVEKIPQLIASIGMIDVLINNAGVMYSLPYDAYPREKVNTMLKLNLEAPIKLIEECAKVGVTRIVNNASIAGQIGHPDVWYGATKAGLINATKSFAKIFDGRMVINAVAPSPVETDMLEQIPLARREVFLKTVVAKRFAHADEVAKTILWLATESPEYINGTTIDINSGSFPR